MNKSRIVIYLLIAVAIVGGFYVGNRKPSSAPTVTSTISGVFKKGDSVPEFTLVDFDGALHTLSEFEGKAIVLDFWAGWCPFCLEEMPELQKAQDAFSDDLVMIGVHRSDTESVETALEFANERGVKYLLVRDDTGDLYRSTNGIGMPVAVFIDKEGVVKEIKSGPKTEEEISEKIEDLI